METLLSVTSIIIGVATIGALLGGGFAIGYNFFKNKTKKVCDLCFREIKAINEQYKKINQPDCDCHNFTRKE